MTQETPKGNHFRPRSEDAAPDATEVEESPAIPALNGSSDESESAFDGEGQGAEAASGSRRARRIAVRAIIVVLVVLSVGAAGAAVFINRSIARGRRSFEQSMQKAVENKGTTVEYNGTTYRLNEDMVSIAFIGFDNRTKNATAGYDVAGQSDTVMVVALDTKSGKATGIVIPRDSMVAVDTYIDGVYNGQHQLQLCLQYSYGSSHEQSSELVTQCASRVLYGMPIDYYFTLNVEGVGPLNDAVGGVRLTPVQSVPPAGIREGVETTLRGKSAELYVQYRETTQLNSSLDRQARQMSYLKAFSTQVLQSAASDPATVLNLYQKALDYTWTNLGFEQFSYLISQMLDHGMTSFNVVSLEGEMAPGAAHAEFHLDADSVYRTVLETYYTPVKE